MRRKIEIAVCTLLIVLTVGFIWNNSSKPPAESQQVSAAVAEKIGQIAADSRTKAQSSFLDVSVDYIRKAAHAVEFFILGIELTVFSFILRKKLKPQSLWNILSSALAIAVIDESIQILSGRGPKVQDVLLDFCGAVCAAAVVILFYFFVIAIYRRRKHIRTK